MISVSGGLVLLKLYLPDSLDFNTIADCEFFSPFLGSDHLFLAILAFNGSKKSASQSLS